MSATLLDDTLGGIANVTGVSLHPDTGAVLVIDAFNGLHEIAEDGTATQLWDGNTAVYGIFLRSEFTDLAVLPGGQIALTARSFGYLLDLETQVFKEHFCYVPGFMPDDPNQPWLTEEDQITDSLTYNRVTGQLMAQPETFDLSSGASMRSEVATFDVDSGADLTWTDTAAFELRSGGMVALDADTVLLGQGSRVATFNPQTGLSQWRDLVQWGVHQIEGMAYDADAHLLYVVDGVSRQLIVLDYAL